jgi:hypothetical protein
LKKAVSILLLFIFLFNVGGYYIVFWALRFQSNEALVARLDNNQYSETETVEIRIPVSLPYASAQQRDFERTKGRFEYKGEFYTLVKQKYQSDTLYIVCIKNHQEKELVKTMKEYSKLSNDLPGTSKKAMNVLGKLLKEYHSLSEIGQVIDQNAWTRTCTYTSLVSFFNSRSEEIHSPPPKA